MVKPVKTGGRFCNLQEREVRSSLSLCGCVWVLAAFWGYDGKTGGGCLLAVFCVVGLTTSVRHALLNPRKDVQLSCGRVCGVLWPHP